MSTPLKPWEANRLQNNGQILRNYGGSQVNGPRSIPVLPPRPPSMLGMTNTYSSYQPYSSYGGMGYGYSSYDMPYRSSLYNSYGSYGNYGMYNTGAFQNHNTDDAERRFIQFAEERSRDTFANVESIVRAFSSLAMMLDNTFFAMTSSFRAVLSVAENFGRLRSMFGHIWYSINIFRLFNWFYRKFMQLMGYKVPEGSKTLAWNEAVSGDSISGATPSSGGGTSWPTLAFLGVLMSAPYFINKLLPKYEDKSKPENWKMPGIRAKGAFDFVATAPSELGIQTNDEILLAPKYIQDEMKLTNTGWAFAVCNGRSGVVPLNYLILAKNSKNYQMASSAGAVSPSTYVSHSEVPVPQNKNQPLKSSLKKVTFGENQIFDVTSNLKTETIIKESSESLKSKTETNNNEHLVVPIMKAETNKSECFESLPKKIETNANECLELLETKMETNKNEHSETPTKEAETNKSEYLESPPNETVTNANECLELPETETIKNVFLEKTETNENECMEVPKKDIETNKYEHSELPKKNIEINKKEHVGLSQKKIDTNKVCSGTLKNKTETNKNELPELLIKKIELNANECLESPKRKTKAQNILNKSHKVANKDAHK